MSPRIVSGCIVQQQAGAGRPRRLLSRRALDHTHDGPGIDRQAQAQGRDRDVLGTCVVCRVDGS
jgi:hypothetical protein